MSTEEIFATFIAESRDLLDEMERGLFALEKTPDDPELLNTVFRAAHTIKGSAGLFSLEAIVAFTHTTENLLDALRKGQIEVSADLINDLLLVIDILREMIDQAERKVAIPNDRPEVARLVRAMQQRLSHLGGASAHGPSSEPDKAANTVSQRWHLSLYFHPDVRRAGNDPVALMRYLEELGEVLVRMPFEQLSLDSDDFDAEQISLGFEVALQTERPREEILAVFDWVAGESQVELIGPGSDLEGFRQALQRLPGDPQAIVSRWQACGSLSAAQAAELSAPATRVAPAVQSAAEATAAVTEKQAAAGARNDGEARFIRIDARRLDKLINLVGELVIAGSGARTLASQSGSEELIEANSAILQLVEDVRDSSLSLRTVPLESIFSRFTRVVREISRDLGKEIAIEFEGGETELDRSLIERVSDPLMHLVRNAADHGLETPEEREKSGKSPQGTIKLSAYYDSGNVVIEIIDDGRGIDTARVRQKALDSGLIRADQVLAPDQIYDLLFQPGFSTASKITNVSGRGVGLDVVRKNLTQIRGSVEVTSTPGQGSRFRLRLPLTLAIIDGFLVSIGRSKYVIPVDMIRECIEAPTLQTGNRASDFFNLRGTVMPYVRLRQLFGSDAPARGRENMVVTQVGERVAGFVVDELLGESQTVIKPLGRLFSNAMGVGGATILGTGEVALILDIPSLMLSIDRESRDHLQQLAA